MSTISITGITFIDILINNLNTCKKRCIQNNILNDTVATDTIISQHEPRVTRTHEGAICISTDLSTSSNFSVTFIDIYNNYVNCKSKILPAHYFNLTIATDTIISQHESRVTRTHEGAIGISTDLSTSSNVSVTFIGIYNNYVSCRSKVLPAH